MDLKSKFYGLVLILTALSFTACDEADELTQFDITEDFSTSFNINIPQDSEGQPASIEEFAGIDITANPQIEENFNLIESVSINSITYEISTFSGVEGATITEASLTLNGETISIANIDLKASDDADTVYELENAIVFNSLSQMLLNSSEISAGISGTVSGTPVQFDVILNFDITVTIDLL